MSAPRRENDTKRQISHVRVLSPAEATDMARQYKPGDAGNLKNKTWQQEYNEYTASVAADRKSGELARDLAKDDAMKYKELRGDSGSPVVKIG